MKDDVYTLDIPQRDGKEGYIGTFFTTHLKMATLLQSPEFSKEPIKFYYMLKLYIGMIPDKKRYDEIVKKQESTQKALTDEYKNKHSIEPTGAARDHILIESVLVCIQDVSQWIDKHIGLSTENKIGFSQNKPGFKDVSDEDEDEEQAAEIPTDSLEGEVVDVKEQP